MRKLVWLRKLSQVVFLGVFIYALWSTTYPLQGKLSPQVLFKIDPLIMFMTVLSERVFLPGLAFAFMMIVLTFILGRVFCGWVCPLGTFIDATGWMRRGSGKRFSASERRHLGLPKFFILGVIVVLALIGVQVAWIFDPVVIVARVISLNVIPAFTLVVDQFFQTLIQKFGLYGGVYDVYRSLKDSILGVNVHFFANSFITLAFFLMICLLSLWVLRLWCRMLCPLGALYALNAKAAWLERKVSDCVSCGKCVQQCRMGAIDDGVHYQKGECILCMDCVYDCPKKSTAFVFRGASSVEDRPKSGKGMTRSQFLLFLGSIVPLFGFKSSGPSESAGHPVIRPPGALSEEKFVNTCVRCGNCMKVCTTNGLQPVMLDSGIEGLWTPQLIPEIGYCEYQCTLCGEVCPTQAIVQLPVLIKQKQSLGLAEIDPKLCIALDGNDECIVCEEHCPVSDKAIKVKAEIFNGKKIFRPSVDPDLCIGCGICQNKCPVRPVRAIRVNPKKV